MSPITTHVLDTAAGKPAAGIPILLEEASANGWRQIGESQTDADGRARNLLPDNHNLAAGRYRLRFNTSKVSLFFPEVAIEFVIEDPAQHYHVPLLLSPYGYTTYRGS